MHIICLSCSSHQPSCQIELGPSRNNVIDEAFFILPYTTCVQPHTSFQHSSLYLCFCTQASIEPSSSSIMSGQICMKINYTAPRSGSLFKFMCNYLLCTIIQSIIFMACRKLNRLHFEVALYEYAWLTRQLISTRLSASQLTSTTPCENFTVL